MSRAPRSSCLVLSGLLSLALPGVAAAEGFHSGTWADTSSASSRVGVHTHDGFFLRASVGLAGTSGRQETEVELVTPDGERSLEPTRLDVSGSGLLLSIDAGASLVENLVLHGRMSELMVPDPSVEVVEGAGWVRMRQVSYVMLAPALTYYVMPLHLHATGAVGIAFANSSRFDGDEQMSDPGWGANLDLGWDLWVGEQWSAGVATRLWYARMDTPGPGGRDLSLESLAAGALLSLTHH